MFLSPKMKNGNILCLCYAQLFGSENMMINVGAKFEVKSVKHTRKNPNYVIHLVTELN